MCWASATPEYPCFSCSCVCFLIKLNLDTNKSVPLASPDECGSPFGPVSQAAGSQTRLHIGLTCPTLIYLDFAGMGDGPGIGFL